jgi:hypothetical protein
VTGEWRKLHNEELHDLYSSPSIIRLIKSRRMRWAGHVARMGEKRNAYRLLVGKQEGKRPLGRPRRRWVDNIRMDLGVVGWGDVDWIGLAHDRSRRRALVNSVLNLRVPWNARKLSSGLTSSDLLSVFSSIELVTKSIKVPGNKNRFLHFSHNIGLPFSKWCCSILTTEVKELLLHIPTSLGSNLGPQTK